MNRKPAIAMYAYNPTTRRMEQVDPESEVRVEELSARFWCESAQRYVSVPGVEAADVYADWKQG